MNSISFKEIGDEHFNEIQEIYNYYVKNTTITFNTDLLTLEEIRDMVMNVNSRYKSFLIMSFGKVTGYVLITQYKKRQAYDKTAEVTIYLKPDYIGNGIGQIALEFIEDFAKAQEFHSLMATICTENERSERLFSKNGYSKNAHFKEIGYKFERFLDIACYQKII
jgi:L-amino acid N-acyltransferase YncA